MPDRNGAKVALVCVLIEAAGLALIWLAPWAVLAFVGVTPTGFGYSLVYPGFGVEALLQRAHRRDGLEVMVEAGNAHPEFARNVFGKFKRLVLADSAALDGPAGTMIIFNTDCLHRGGRLVSGQERMVVRGSSYAGFWGAA